jgi:hypothetical protein
MQTEYTAKAIIARIESTDPADAAGLDEIDRQVAHYLGVEVAPFTRSRDAVKSIRPPKFWIKVENWPHGCTQVFGLFMLNKLEYVNFQSGAGTTEELAELHTTIQGIAYTQGYRISNYEATTPWILHEDED